MIKEFDYEKAKAGAPVCTRKGLKARIILWDAKNEIYPIIALVEMDGYGEIPFSYTPSGYYIKDGFVDDVDLMMAATKKKLWTNLYNIPGTKMYETLGMYLTEEDARNASLNKECHIATCKIEWEE